MFDVRNKNDLRMKIEPETGHPAVFVENIATFLLYLVNDMSAYFRM